MKKRGFTLQLARSQGRMHRALFDPQLPFQHRVEKNRKKQHARKSKHSKGNPDHDAS
jgi:hypothetical protein